jgi:hypothetical protein
VKRKGKSEEERGKSGEGKGLGIRGGVFWERGYHNKHERRGAEKASATMLQCQRLGALRKTDGCKPA